MRWCWTPRMRGQKRKPQHGEGGEVDLGIGLEHALLFKKLPRPAHKSSGLFQTAGKAKPVMRAPALAELHEIFLGQAGGALELVAGKHYRCDTANAEVGKDGSYRGTLVSKIGFRKK